MPAKTTAYDTALLQLIFNKSTMSVQNNANSASVTLAADGSALPNLYVSLHYASPGLTGYQNTTEASYSTYARQPVPRTNATPGWSISGSSVSPTQTISFPAATGVDPNTGNQPMQYFGVGTSLTGAGTLLYFGGISPTITITAGVTPQLTTTSSITEA